VIGRTVRAVVFDLDGTLIHSPLDLDRIRRQLGLAGLDLPLLESIKTLRGPDRYEAIRLLHEHERHASRESAPAWRARQTIEALRNRGMKVAVLTRNRRATTIAVARMHALEVDCVFGRDDGSVKPDPHGLWRILELFDVQPGQTLMVGDHLMDLTTAGRAGAIPVLLRHRTSNPRWADHAALVIDELPELLDRLT